MIQIRFEEREKIGLQYILESLHGCSPFGQERIRRLRYYTPDERQELELELRNVERAAAHAEELKDLYDQRKETIERIFGSSKEYHGFRYTNMIGKARMTMKAALTFTCINLKKLAKIKGGNPSLSGYFKLLQQILMSMFEAQNKMAPAMLAETTLSTICSALRGASLRVPGYAKIMNNIIIV